MSSGRLFDQYRDEPQRGGRREGGERVNGPVATTQQAGGGVIFTPEQRQWLDAIKDHIAKSLAIELDDFDEVPFSQYGGLGKAYVPKLPGLLSSMLIVVKTRVLGAGQ